MYHINNVWNCSRNFCFSTQQYIHIENKRNRSKLGSIWKEKIMFRFIFTGKNDLELVTYRGTLVSFTLVILHAGYTIHVRK